MRHEKNCIYLGKISHHRTKLTIINKIQNSLLWYIYDVYVATRKSIKVMKSDSDYSLCPEINH